MRWAGIQAAAVLTGMLGLAACAGTTVPDELDFLTEGVGGNREPRQVVIPNQVAGGDRSGQRMPGERTEEQQALTDAEIAALRSERQQAAESLWARAVQSQNPETAGDLFEELADDYPDSLRAAEARFQLAKRRFQQGEYGPAIRALATYMEVAPVNPHLAEVEELLFLSATRLLEEDQGIRELFRTDEEPLQALVFLSTSFQAGEYADDALWRLGQYWQAEGGDALADAVRYYKELLLEYPDSEWSFLARIALGDTYLIRDQGGPYHAGFVDVDHRETFPNDQARMMGGPVKSGLLLALEQYEAFLDRIERDPGRRAEYAEQVAYAQRKRAEVRESLASKELAIAEWYARRGDRQAAQTYYKYAARFDGTPSGNRAASMVRGGRSLRAQPRTTRPATVTPAPRRPATTPVPRTRPATTQPPRTQPRTQPPRTNAPTFYPGTLQRPPPPPPPPNEQPTRR